MRKYVWYTYTKVDISLNQKTGWQKMVARKLESEENNNEF